MATSQIVKWGNSLAIRIPKPVAEKARVREGDPMLIEASDGRIRLRRSRPRVPALRELVAQMDPKNRYKEVSAGLARGKEKVEW